MTSTAHEDQFLPHPDDVAQASAEAFADQQPAASAEPSDVLSENEWYDLAQRHATRDWNGNGFLAAIQEVCMDFLSKLRAAGEPVIHQHGFAGDNQRLRTINESLDKQLEEVMSERDDYHDWADELSQAISAHLSIDIGEHSSSNLPWLRALDAIKNAAPVATQKADDARDAERYRWLRAHFRFAADSDCEIWFDSSLKHSPADQLDSAIDAAIAQQRKGE